MPSLLRPALGALLATGLAALALIAAPAVAQTPPAGGVAVTIQPPDGGSPVTISTADIANGDMRGVYTVGSQKITVNGGVSLYQLLDRANANFGYAEIEVPRPDGEILRLSKDQVEDTKPAGFYTDEQGVTRFIGPTVDGAVAPSDYFEVGPEITLTQLREPKLKVSISPKSKKIELGGTVRFQARVTGNDPDEIVTYSWWVDPKKQRAGGPRHTHTFPRKDGVYEMSVTVRIEGSPISQTAVAKITVGDPKKGKTGQTGSGDAADGGTTGDGTGGGSGYGTGGSSGYTPPSYAPATPEPSTPTPAPPSPPSSSLKPDTPPDIATSGTTVEGNLLADVGDSPPSNILESAARAAREGREREQDAGPDGAGVSEAALSIAGVLALLALGAGIETRQGRRPRWRMPQLRLPRRTG